MQFIDLKSQYLHLNKRIDKRVESVLSHGKYIMGPEVEELEARLEDYVGVKHAITCANGTDALQLCMLALDIKVGDAVFCSQAVFCGQTHPQPIIATRWVIHRWNRLGPSFLHW